VSLLTNTEEKSQEVGISRNATLVIVVYKQEIRFESGVNMLLAEMGLTQEKNLGTSKELGRVKVR